MHHSARAASDRTCALAFLCPPCWPRARAWISRQEIKVDIDTHTLVRAVVHAIPLHVRLLQTLASVHPGGLLA